jgi:hypothetical protein
MDHLESTLNHRRDHLLEVWRRQFVGPAGKVPGLGQFGRKMKNVAETETLKPSDHGVRPWAAFPRLSIFAKLVAARRVISRSAPSRSSSGDFFVNLLTRATDVGFRG